MAVDFAVTQLTADDVLLLYIDGVEPIPVVQFTASWAVNEVPVAQCLVPVGRTFAGGGWGAEDPGRPGWQNDVRPFAPARVVFRPRGWYNQFGDPWPDQPVVVFSGYFDGYAYRRSQDKTQIVVNLTHWLIDLAASHVLSANWHPTNPASLAQPALLNLSCARVMTGADGGNAFVPDATAVGLTTKTVTADLWGAIKRVFCCLAQSSPLQLGPIEGCITPQLAARNEKALRALARIEGPGLSAETDYPYRYGRPLVIDGADQATVGLLVRNAVVQVALEPAAGTTFWEKLINGYGPAFGLSVIPLSDRALVVGDLPVLGDTWWQEIRADEYESFDQTAAMSRPIRGVGVYGQAGSFLGIAQTGPDQSGWYVGGCHLTDNAGTLLYTSAPSWLNTLSASLARQYFRRGRPEASAIRAVGENPTAGVDRAAIASVARLYNRYARCVYALYALKDRGGTLSGKLRFDIGPGSIVKIRAADDVDTRRGRAGDRLGSDFFGCVSRVTVNINAEAPAAGTTFQLTHLRTESENRDFERWVVREHPIFGNAIFGSGRHGSPLVPEYESLVE